MKQNLSRVQFNGKLLLGGVFMLLFLFPRPAFATNVGNFTVSVWVNPTSSIASKALITKAEELRLVTDSNGKPLCQTKTTSWQTAVTASQGLALQSWSHVVCAYDLVNIKVYVNGIQTGSQALTAVPDDTSNVFYAGRDASSGSGYGYFQGTMDEYKFYNYALTGDEIHTDYNRGFSLILGSLSNTSGLAGGTVASNSASAAYCIPGDTTSCAAPVGEWNFEEGSGGTVNDSSGNGMTGTMVNSPTWVSGKFGKAGNFNGASARQGVQISSNALLNPGTGSFTAEAWIKTSQTGSWKRIVTKRGSSTTWYTMAVVSGKLIFETAVSYPTYYTSSSGNKTINDGQWHHVVMIRDASQSKILLYVDGALDVNPSDGTAGQSITNSEIFEIATWGSEAYDSGSYTGKIDQVRFYNYARSAAQIAWDYNRGKPVGYWAFDECSGSVANDRSGNSNNGTITIGATGSQTVLGTCTTPTDGTGAWYNGRTGKYNSAMSFDGIDDYVDAGSGINYAAFSGMTLAAWVKRSTVGSRDYIVSAGYAPYQFEIWNTNTIGVEIQIDSTYYNLVSSKTFTSTDWSHLVFTHNLSSGAWYIYVNGNVFANGTRTGAAYTGSNSTRIGNHTGAADGMFGGQIDDVQIFNYALNQTQVKLLYNQGSSVRYGPVTGSP